MNKGFFSTFKLLSKPALPRAPHCGLCGLYKTCQSPKMPFTGQGKKKILFVAEAPGIEEDKRNTQLIGKAGQRLRRTLKKLGVDLDRDCWKTNAIICRPPKNKTPDDSIIEACRANLFKTIKTTKPNLIILLGLSAVKSLIGTLWKENVGEISRWVGSTIPSQKPNAWIAPTYHSSYLVRMDSKVLNLIFEKHLQAALKKCKSKPWDMLPNYKDQIEIVTKPSQVAILLKEIIKKNRMTAFDYETNCLKPEVEGAKIVSCSICNGKRTFAYPWFGEAIEATDKFLKSPVPKIASNMKFEDRWTKVHLGHFVKNWLWDTMIAAHVIDNRRGITSIKFQSFILLGAQSYDEHITPFLKEGKGSKINRIDEIDLKDLLEYNSLDSLYEYEVAKKQMKVLDKR